MSNRWYTQFFGSLHKKPIQLDCNFVVSATDVAGYGLTSLKGPGISNVFMNSTATFTADTATDTTLASISINTSGLAVGMLVKGTGIPANTTIATIVSSSAVTLSHATTATNTGTTVTFSAVGSPNPAAGLIIVQLQDNFNRYFFGTSQFMAPVTGGGISISGSSVMTIGAVYQIVTVGTSTQANWAAAGLPAGVVPAVGEPFVALIAGSATGTGTVKAVGASAILNVEPAGDPNLTLGANYNGAAILGGGSGAYMILKCLNGSAALTAPAAGSLVQLSFFLGNSSILVQGE